MEIGDWGLGIGDWSIIILIKKFFSDLINYLFHIFEKLILFYLEKYNKFIYN